MTTTTETGPDRTGPRKPVTGRLGGAFGAAGRAYAAGVLELGRALGGVGRDVLTDAGAHVRATVRARNLRELAELQAAFAQHRFEMAATHAKEVADLARAKSGEVIAPIARLGARDRAG